MKIAIISGSHREHGQSHKVAQHIANNLSELLNTESYLFSLAGNPLPLWDQGVWDGDAHWHKILAPIKEELSRCDGLVIITPEWHGQVPAGLKNFFLLFGQQELGHKPALIVSVSAGSGGSYPVAELRMSSYKNSRICYLPEHIIIRKVETILNDNPEENDLRSDSYYRERIQWCLQILLEYSKALRAVRDSGVNQHDKFKTGM